MFAFGRFMTVLDDPDIKDPFSIRALAQKTDPILNGRSCAADKSHSSGYICRGEGKRSIQVQSSSVTASSRQSPSIQR
jgi:hypothetical protein